MTLSPCPYDPITCRYAKHGAHIKYLSLFNEPIDSYTVISDDEMANLLGNHVGPLFDRLGLRPGTKLTYGGQATRQWAGMHIPAIMQHENASKYMDHFAYHGYDCQFNCTKEMNQYSQIEQIHRQWPDKEIIMAEICYAYNGDDPNCTSSKTMKNCTDWPRNHSLAPALPRFDFIDGRIWGSRIISDLEAGTSAWIYWNLILNMQGGPFQFSPQHADDSENLQQAMVHVDPKAGTYRMTGLFWYLAHFAKFVRPGAVRIGTTQVGNKSSPAMPEGTDGIETIAFTNGGTVVLQLLNHNAANESVEVTYAGQHATLDLPAVSITTASWQM